mgnify:CR=1 FL=1
MVYRLLLVEDDPEIREIIMDYFMEKSNGAIVINVAETGLDGQVQCINDDYDLILLDVMLPEVDGFTICRELRKTSDVPIIFLTAKENESDRLHGYNLGCDDYITKPFSLAELYAKVNALLKRSKGMVGKEIMTVGRIKLDPYRWTVYVNEEMTLSMLQNMITIMVCHTITMVRFIQEYITLSTIRKDIMSFVK